LLKPGAARGIGGSPRCHSITVFAALLFQEQHAANKDISGAAVGNDGYLVTNIFHILASSNLAM
jgi:hypothetical protein